MSVDVSFVCLYVKMEIQTSHEASRNQTSLEVAHEKTGREKKEEWASIETVVTQLQTVSPQCLSLCSHSCLRDSLPHAAERASCEFELKRERIQFPPVRMCKTPV